MQNAFIGEITVYRMISNFITLIKNSITNDTSHDQNQSLIDNIFNGFTVLNDFNPVKEMKALFANDKPLYLKLGFNINTAELPAVHIVLPDENLEFEGIGLSPHYEFDSDGTNPREVNNVNFDCSYNIIIVAPNSDAVIFIYRILKYMFLASWSNMEASGFMKLRIRGSDLINQSTLIPTSLYSRNLSLSFTYEEEFINSIQPEFGNSLTPEEILIDINT